MDTKFSKLSRLAVAALIASVGALAQAQEQVQVEVKQESIKPMSKIEAAAACDSIIEKIESMRKVGNIDNARRQAKICDEAIQQIYSNLRKDGQEFFVFGVGVFLGMELNSPSFKRVSGGIRAAVGGSMFVADSPAMRFTPLINVVPASTQYALKGNSQLIEPQLGVILYIGSHSTKSINDFNGLYAGGGVEVPYFFASNLQNRSTMTLNAYRNIRGNWAIVTMKSFTAGSEMKGGNAQLLYVNNVTRDGAGSAFSSLFKGIGGEFADIIVGAADSIWNAMKSPFQ